MFYLCKTNDSKQLDERMKHDLIAALLSVRLLTSECGFVEPDGLLADINKKDR